MTSYDPGLHFFLKFYPEVFSAQIGTRADSRPYTTFWDNPQFHQGHFNCAEAIFVLSVHFEKIT